MRIEITRNDGPLSRQVWIFWVTTDSSIRILLDSYQVESRESTRKRKWNPSAYYYRLSRGYRVDSSKVIKSLDVPMPDSVEEQVYVEIGKEMRAAGISIRVSNSEGL